MCIAVAVVTATTTAAGVKSCSDAKDKLEKAAEDGKKRSDNLNKTLDCLSNPNCSATTAQDASDQATQNLKDALDHMAEATKDLATSVPGTSVTGPLPTSIPEAAVSGTITTVVTGTSSR